MGLLLTALVAAITFVADYMEARRQQADTARIQTNALISRLNVIARELRAAGAFLSESDRALSRFDGFIDQLSGTTQQQAHWAVAATSAENKNLPFKAWAEGQFQAIGSSIPEFATPSNGANVVMVATGANNALVPGKAVTFPARITLSNGPVPVSSGELELEGSPNQLWLILQLKPTETQLMSGVSALVTMRRVDLERLRIVSGLTAEQGLKIGWLLADSPSQSRQIGTAYLDRANQTAAATQVGSYELQFTVDNPPMDHLPRTWLLLLLAGGASTAFWVAWRAAGTLNLRAWALEEVVGETSGKLRVIHEKESAFFENAGTPQCEVDPATGRFLRVNHALCNWLGYEAAELLQKTAYEISAQEDVAVSHLHVEKAKTSNDKLLQLEKRYIKKNGEKVWGLVTSNLFTDPISGDRIFLTTIVDITVRKEADAMRDRLLRELAHRVRNTMQLTDSLARQSAVGTRSAHSYAADFRSRLSALSRAQDILFETNWVSAEMRELATRIVKPFDHGKISIDLPQVELPPQHAQTFALAVHELISRSAERGAVKNGQPVEFTGKIDGVDEFGKRKLTLIWKEAVAKRGRRSEGKTFGDTMLKLALPRQFDGDAEILNTSKGFTYVAHLTLPDE